jgi:hypothetical protein
VFFYVVVIGLLRIHFLVFVNYRSITMLLLKSMRAVGGSTVKIRSVNRRIIQFTGVQTGDINTTIVNNWNFEFTYIKPKPTEHGTPKNAFPALTLDLLPFERMKSQKLPMNNNGSLYFKMSVDKEFEKLLLQERTQFSNVVSVSGRFTSGKSFLLRNLYPEIITTQNCPTGVAATTAGFNCYCVSHGEAHTVVVDTEGYDSPMAVMLDDDKIQHRLCKEFMTRRILLDTADIALYVTSVYSLRDETHIRGLLASKKSVFAVHNPYQLKTAADVKAYLTQFDKKFKVADATDQKLWKEYFNYFSTNGLGEVPRNPFIFKGNNVPHYFLFNADVREFREWNEAQLISLRNAIKNDAFKLNHERPNSAVFGDRLCNSFFNNL